MTKKEQRTANGFLSLHLQSSFEQLMLRKSWRDAQRPISIDFGDENLFWIKEGMGTRRGCGRQVSKKDFIAKNGGDLELLALIIDNSNKKVGR